MKYSSISACVALLLTATSPLVRGAFPQYHDISDTPAAQAEAKQRNLPLAYLGSFPESLTNGSPDSGSIDDLTQMALATLQGNAVVIFFDGRNMAPVPDFIHAQYHIQDDGPLPNGAAWVSPKIVFCDPGMTKILGRVSYTQMKAERDTPITSVLLAVKNNPNALTPLHPHPEAVLAANAPATDDGDAPASPATLMDWLKVQNPVMLWGMGIFAVAIVFWLFRPRRY